MANLQIFYETLWHGIVPVEFVGWKLKPKAHAHHAVLRVTGPHHRYNVGDIIKCDAFAVVALATDGLLTVAALPVRTDDNTLPMGNF